MFHRVPGFGWGRFHLEVCMGQYHLILNLDKRQYLEPHAFGEGAKLLEFGASMEGTMTAQIGRASCRERVCSTV